MLQLDIFVILYHNMGRFVHIIRILPAHNPCVLTKPSLYGIFSAEKGSEERMDDHPGSSNITLRDTFESCMNI